MSTIPYGERWAVNPARLTEVRRINDSGDPADLIADTANIAAGGPASIARARAIAALPLVLDGSPILLIGTYRETATNRKTGAMLQTWIIRADIDPLQAIASGADSAVCGMCPARGPSALAGAGGIYRERSCYVNVGQAPLSVFRAAARGRYRVLSHAELGEIGADRHVRLGSYGDPAAVPVERWRAVLARSIGHTGYSHQWRNPIAAPLREFCMASVDTLAEAREARALGWRTFRVRLAGDPIADREHACPAAAESGAKLQCVDCLACGGADGRRGSPTIIVHGSMARRFADNVARASTGGVR